MLFKISPYSLPFNLIVLTFLYALKLREKRPQTLIETPVQMGKPETNLYLYSRNAKRFPAAFPVSATLPFYGEWQVSQAHNGEHTHKGAWRHAWDFIITDNKGNQFKNSGDLREDYYCFGKSVLAPADGEIAEVVDNIPDNVIGDVNTKDNWGNTVIIKHDDFIYSKLSHLKFQSIKIKPGNKVKKGQIIALCGNSGRSPYPHLHFQFQSKPYVGSFTIDYPVGQFLVSGKTGYILKSFDYPAKDEVLANPPVNETLAKALRFIPGRRMEISVETDSLKAKWKKMAGVYHWTVETDVYNNTFISCEEHNGRAYLYNNGDMHYFTNFSGKKHSPLFWFFIMLYKVPLGFLPDSRITDSLPVNHLFGGLLKILQDFAAPFYLFLNADYQLTIVEGGEIISSGNVNMNTQITKKIAGQIIKLCDGKLNINQQGDFDISIETKEAKIKIICQNKLEQ
jgi:murein DD-endopeptidase MepM/ murein hydrolase activator NlpD